MFKRLIDWWKWRNAHKVTDPKLKKAMQRGIITPREALAAQKGNKMIPECLEKRNEALFNRLVPASGKCDTLEGEMLRAVNRIIYRYYNDGDYWYTGYGIETAGPAEAFLREFGRIDLRPEIEASDRAEGEDYEKALTVLFEKVLDHIESCTQFLPNYQDMLDCEPRYEEEEEEEDDYYAVKRRRY